MAPASIPQPSTKYQTLTHWFGLTYVIVSLATSVYTLWLFAPYMSNAYFYPGFHTASQLIMNLLHEQLTLNIPDTLIDLSMATITTQINIGYGRMILHRNLISPANAIQGLRTLDPSQFTFVATKYCWVDLNRTWEMGVTQKSQQRCIERDFSNGAVYLEAVLRNFNFRGWYSQDSSRFAVRVLAPISATEVGRQWTQSLLSHQLVPIEDEIKVWQSFGIEYFQLLYANLRQSGIRETITIINALGQNKIFTLTNIPPIHRGLSNWLTYIFTSSFEFDMQGIGPNQSLVRNTSNFYADIDPLQIQTLIIGMHPSLPYQAFAANVGSLTNIRTRWITPPNQLISFVQKFRTLILSNLQNNAPFAMAFAQIPISSVLHPTPPQWQTPQLQFYGGSPICGHGRPLSYVQESFAFDDVCSSQLPLTYHWKAINSLFAVLISNVSTPHTLCQPSDAVCCSNVQSTLAAAALLLAPVLNLPQLPWNISIMQYVAPVTNLTNVTLQLQHLLDPVWLPFGLLSIYDWVMNEREVVSFEGDIEILYLMSAAYEPVTQTTEEADASLGSYLWRTSAVTSVVLALFGITTVCIGIVGVHESSSSSSWFYFNRVTSSVYLNRSILTARAIVAFICLSSTNMVPITVGGAMQLSVEHRPIIVSCLFAGESLWFYYVLQELVYPITHAGRWSAYGSVVLWVVIAALDVFAPPTVQASISRSCVDINMDVMIYCHSGEIQVGSLTRMYTLAGVQIGWIVLICIVHCHVNCDDTRSLLVPPTVLAQIESKQTVRLDRVTAFMCGLWHVRDAVFDTKLWINLPSNLYSYDKQHKSIKLPNMAECVHARTLSWVMPDMPKGPTFNAPVFVKVSWCGCSWKLVYLVLGFLYLGCTLISNILYLSIAQEYMANDYFWAGFNATGGYAFLANLYNQQLLISSKRDLVLDSNTYIDYTQPYNNTVSTIFWPASAARRALHDPNVTTIATAITGLRSMDPCKLPWMFTQYCWVDFNQTWSVASSSRREKRCRAMSNNGAVYLEAGLRNVRDWDAWDICWGTSFDIGIRRHLMATTQGQTWLHDTQSNTISVSAEAVYWRSFDIWYFDLQWQNYKTIGFTDTILIENALGLTYTLLLSQVSPSFHPTHQTSMLMYWSFASDLWSVSTNSSWIGGMSLIRSSPNFAFSNVSSESLLVQNLTLASPLTAGYAILESRLGPFNAIDMMFVPCPRSLIEFYDSFASLISRLTTENLAIQDEFVRLPSKYLILEVPSRWLRMNDSASKGGNIFCDNDQTHGPLFLGFGVGFSHDNVCNSNIFEGIESSTLQHLLALFAFNITLDLKDTDYNEFCSSDAIKDVSCVNTYRTIGSFLSQHHEQFNVLSSSGQRAYTETYPLNIVVIQYITNLSNGELGLHKMNLLDKQDRSWNYFGWLILIEWIIGQREVVAFYGDSGGIVTISAGIAQGAMNPSATAQSFAYFFQQCVLFISMTFLIVAAVVVINAVAAFGNIEGRNLFKVNRVVGVVWIGRTLIFVRATTALGLLHTATLRLVEIGHGSKFVSPALPWYKYLLASAESTWLIYVLNDLFSFWTQEYTRKYASKSSSLAWCVTFLWTYFVPHRCIATCNRQCTFIDMDSGIACISGFIGIGSTNRVLISLGICLGSILLCYAFERLQHPTLEQHTYPTPLLNSESFYALKLEKVQGERYLDYASAAMAGILSLKYDNSLYLFDIKSWRAFKISALPPKSVNSNLYGVHGSIPLSQI